MPCIILKERSAKGEEWIELQVGDWSFEFDNEVKKKIMHRILGKLVVEPASDRYDSTSGPVELRGQYKTAGDMPLKLREHVYFIRCPTILAVVEAFEECGYQYAGGSLDNI